MNNPCTYLNVDIKCWKLYLTSSIDIKNYPLDKVYKNSEVHIQYLFLTSRALTKDLCSIDRA